MSSRWFISHSARGEEMSPIFFRALRQFDESNTNVEMIWPPMTPEELANRKIELDHSQLVIAEVSVTSLGTGVDLGFAYAAQIPVIAFHQGSAPLSPLISTIATSVHTYLTDEHILKVLQTLG